MMDVYMLILAQEDQWNEHFIKIACLAALRSKDPVTAVSHTIATITVECIDQPLYRLEHVL